MLKAGQECPEKPVIPSEDIRRLRLNVILEEVVELANAMGFCCQFNYTDFKPEPSWIDQVEIADAIGDLLYVTLGCAVALGLNTQPIFDEVHRSNMTKFIDGHRREDGKWIKGPSYSPANLEPIIKEQMK